MLADRGNVAHSKTISSSALIEKILSQWGDVCLGQGVVHEDKSNNDDGATAIDKISQVDLLCMAKSKGIIKDAEGKKISIKTNRKLHIAAITTHDNMLLSSSSSSLPSSSAALPVEPQIEAKKEEPQIEAKKEEPQIEDKKKEVSDDEEAGSNDEEDEEDEEDEGSASEGNASR